MGRGAWAAGLTGPLCLRGVVKTRLEGFFICPVVAVAAAAAAAEVEGAAAAGDKVDEVLPASSVENVEPDQKHWDQKDIKLITILLKVQNHL